MVVIESLLLMVKNEVERISFVGRWEVFRLIEMKEKESVEKFVVCVRRDLVNVVKV